MIAKVLRYVEKYHMLQAGDTVAAGISGGADSVCLLFVMRKIQEFIPFRLEIVHVHHGLRPEADEDAAFVRALCEEWGCSFHCIRVDVKGYSAASHMSTEEAGRVLRYQAFADVLTELGVQHGKIAVAHNQNDNAETVLFHLLRGSGLPGLAGIRPVRDTIIRPLLCLPRNEIEAFLEAREIPYCIDQTNNEDTYTRNKIRHHILPYAEREICAGTVSHICDTSVIIGEAEAYIRRNAMQALHRCLTAGSADGREADAGTVSACGNEAKRELVLDVTAFLQEDPFLQKQLLLLAMEKTVGSRRDLGAVHVEILHQLFTRQGNGHSDLPYGMTACREYERVRLCIPDAGRAGADAREAEQGERADWKGKPLQIPGETIWQEGLVVSCRLFPYEKSKNIPQKTYTKWFDYDKIIKYLMLRTRQSGDYLQLREDGGRKSLKSYFIDEKIPAQERSRQLLLADGSHVLWVIGRRISGHYKVNEQTKTILEVQVTGGAFDGRED